MQHDRIVSEVLELEFLDRRRHLLGVERLVEDAERQHEDRVLWRDWPVITTFVHIDDGIVERASACAPKEERVYQISRLRAPGYQ